MIDIYISPANHPKKYCIKGYNEKQQMELLAPLLKAELENKYIGAVVHLPTIFNKNQQYTGRPEEARGLGCDAYVALHSNAGGGKGACLFYHPSFALSKEMALSIVTELNHICPIKSNRAKQPAIYAWNKGAFNFGELRVPAKYGIVPVLIEHEFHDTAEGAAWLINSLEAIAKADARGIAKALGLRRRGDVNGDGVVDNLDAVAVLKHDAGIKELSADELKAADANGDGVVDNSDATMILKEDAGI